jgi:hypothetical protein
MYKKLYIMPYKYNNSHVYKYGVENQTVCKAQISFSIERKNIIIFTLVMASFMVYIFW